MKYFAILVALLLLASGIYIVLAKPFALQPTGAVACTQEAMQCPDGSYVGRTGPNCAFAACPQLPQATSGIQGTVLLGPTCPIQRNPPDPQCADKTFQTTLSLKSAGTKVIKTFTSNANGTFMIQVPPGTYTVTSAPSSSMLPRCSSNGTITVSTGAIASTTIYCDTGIR